jgi:hypothetical protein
MLGHRALLAGGGLPTAGEGKPDAQQREEALGGSAVGTS